MNEFLEQFGVNGKLFLSQLINFAVILTILNFFVYKPLIKIIKERNKKIKEGLDKAEEAGARLKEIDIIGKEKLHQAQTESINIIKATEKRAKDLEVTLQQKLEENHLRAQKDLEVSLKKQHEEAQNLVIKNAVELVKKTIIKTVELDPDKIDEALINKAVKQLEINEAK